MIFSRLPFDMNRWPGYIIAYLMESVQAFVSVSTVVPVMCLFCGSCWILTSVGNDVTKEFNELNVNEIENANQTAIRQRFCSITKRFSDAKQFSKYLLNKQRGN